MKTWTPAELREECARQKKIHELSSLSDSSHEHGGGSAFHARKAAFWGSLVELLDAVGAGLSETDQRMAYVLAMRVLQSSFYELLLLSYARAMVRAAELSAEHAAVCPIETETCLKCDQLVADQQVAEKRFLGVLPSFGDYLDETRLIDRTAEAMRERLRANRGKSGWRELTVPWLVHRVRQETSELNRTIRDGAPPEDVIREAADVANFAGMIIDNLRSVAT